MPAYVVRTSARVRFVRGELPFGLDCTAQLPNERARRSTGCGIEGMRLLSAETERPNRFIGRQKQQHT